MSSLEHQPPAGIPPKWTFVLGSIVILLALGAVIFWLFGARPQFQYPLVIALLCFALSTAACLLFAAHAKLEATLPVATLTMGGPAIVWVGTLVLFSYIFPPPKEVSPQSLVDVLRADQMKDGWRTFPDWIKQLGNLGKDVLRDEAGHVRDVMNSTYNIGAGRQKIKSPILHDLVVYLDDKTTIDFMRVRGSKDDVAEIYTRPTTTQSGKVGSLLLTKTKDKITAAELGDRSNWSEIREETLDCLIIYFFEEGMVEHGDFLYFGTNRFRKSGDAIYNFGILSFQPINQPRGWLLRGFSFPLIDEVPVIFKARSTAWQSNVDGISGELEEWFSLLDKSSLDKTRKAKEADFIEMIKEKMPDKKFSNFHKSEAFKSRYSGRFDELQDAIAITFEKK